MTMPYTLPAIYNNTAIDPIIPGYPRSQSPMYYENTNLGYQAPSYSSYPGSCYPGYTGEVLPALEVDEVIVVILEVAP